MKISSVIKLILFVVLLVGTLFFANGISTDNGGDGDKVVDNSTEESTPEESTPEESTPEESTPEESTPEESTPEESTPEESSSEEVDSEEETTKAPYVGAWTLLSNEPLNPTKSGYEELDTLIEDLFEELKVDSQANGYYKAWVCYEYMIDKITYSRGMDANAGMYSTSDPASTPVEVLWATDLLNSGMGCCYNYSAAYMYILRALGYDAHLISGNVPKYGGGVTPHCWVYANINGDKYIFDPDIDMNFYTRAVNNGSANPRKDQYFCVRMDTVSYFYAPEKYHTN